VGIRQLLKENHRWQDYMHDYVAEADLSKIYHIAAYFVIVTVIGFVLAVINLRVFLTIGK
jgi:hypothetical protein